MRDAYIVSAARTACGRGKKGSLRQTRPEDLGRLAIRGALAGVPDLDPADVDDVVLGCAMPEGCQGMNLARLVSLYSGLPDTVPAATINRFCSSGLQSIAQAAMAVMGGFVDTVVAGGIETMTLVPMPGFHFSAHPTMATDLPDIFMGMGTTAENVAVRFDVTREQQDEFAYNSHRKAAAAQEAGRFSEELVPVPYELRDEKTGELSTGTLDRDETVRGDTTLEGLAKLRPAFSPKGSVTAGNSSPLTDGGAAVIVMSEEAVKRTNATPIVRLVDFQVAGVAPDIMGIAPSVVVPKLYKHADVTQDDIDIFELNEAFASQSVYCLRELGIDPEKVNVNGGAIALGHPLGATGAKLTATIVHEMKRRQSRYGIVSMCIGGGQGAAALFERC
jgi:acetyl-CoA acyltransferase